ncbi:hypothetical protein Tco_0719989 [Tanacetum coccineum]
MVATYEEHGSQVSVSGSGISESGISGLVPQLRDEKDEPYRAMLDVAALKAKLNSLQLQVINDDLGIITSQGGPSYHMQTSKKELAILKSPLDQESMFSLSLLSYGAHTRYSGANLSLLLLYILKELAHAKSGVVSRYNPEQGRISDFDMQLLDPKHALDTAVVMDTHADVQVKFCLSSLEFRNRVVKEGDATSLLVISSAGIPVASDHENSHGDMEHYANTALSLRAFHYIGFLEEIFKFFSLFDRLQYLRTVKLRLLTPVVRGMHHIVVCRRRMYRGTFPIGMRAGV